MPRTIPIFWFLFLVVANAQQADASSAINDHLPNKNVGGWEALVNHDHRLLRIGDSISRATAELCQGAGTLGFSIGHLADIAPDQWPYVRRAYSNVSGPVFITAIAPGSAADAAGLQVGQAIAAIGSNLIGGYSTDQIWKMMTRIKVGSVVDITLENGQVKTLEPVAACPLIFVVDTSKKLTAGYDGVRVRLTGAMMNFANDDELAAIIAHEASHAILCHHLRKQSKGRREAEADRLSARVMIAAGFDIAGASSFWRKFGKRRGLTDMFDWSHGRSTLRIKRIKGEHAIILKESNGSPLGAYAGARGCLQS